MRAPGNWCAREGASVQFASRCGRGQSIQPHRCAARGVLQTLRNDAVESTVRRRSGSLIACSRVSRARQKTGARVDRRSGSLIARAR
eukprot:5951059-Lingulodinium_polyedra.AAC.1